MTDDQELIEELTERLEAAVQEFVGRPILPITLHELEQRIMEVYGEFIPAGIRRNMHFGYEDSKSTYELIVYPLDMFTAVAMLYAGWGRINELRHPSVYNDLEEFYILWNNVEYWLTKEKDGRISMRFKPPTPLAHVDIRVPLKEEAEE